MMPSSLVVLPVLIPILTSTSALVRYRVARRVLVLTGLTLNLIACLALLTHTQTSGPLVTQMAGHPAPFGISLVADALTAIMLTITAIISVAVAVFSYATIDANRERFAYYPMLALLVLGINFAFLTGDVFTLYVAFEVMLMSSFVLLTLGGERSQIGGGLKYVALNLMSSTVFLIAAAMTYGVAGTLNMAELSQRLSGLEAPGITTVLAVLYLTAFGIKAGIFPLFFWLPASYHTPPIAVTAIFGALLTKVGIYSMWRVIGLLFPQEIGFLQPLIFTLAGATMITGVLGAIAQMEVRRLLSFHIISQIGYLVMGFGLFNVVGITASVFFMVHVILAKTALFLISGIAYKSEGTYWLKKLGGLQRSNPFLAFLFLCAAMSLAGMPPFAGFWAKLALIQAGLEAQQYGIVAVAIFTSILTLFSMIKIWNEAFWKKGSTAPAREVARPLVRTALYAPTIALVALIILIGVLVEPMYQMAQRAAEGLVERANYTTAVLVNGEAGE
ncbi:MAG: proton-conducting transporter membrane subunit [Chloroflexota bacterium]|nr:MAG: Na+/H+ antiporter subunit D [Chloroflexota bacterium]